MRKKIGVFSARIIEILELDIPAGTPIYITDSNIEHMKTFHSDDFVQIPAHLTTHSAKSWSVFPDVTERVSASADQ